MALLPVGIAGNIARPDIVGLKESLTTTAVGIIVFFIGWWLAASRKPS